MHITRIADRLEIDLFGDSFSCFEYFRDRTIGVYIRENWLIKFDSQKTEVFWK